MSTEAILPEDPRTDIQRLSRIEIRHCLDKMNIQLTPNMSLQDGVKMLEATGVNIRQLVEFEPIPVKTQQGLETVQYHPKRVIPTHSQEYEHRREEELSKRLEEAEAKQKEDDKKAETLTSDNAALAKQVEQLTELVLGMRAELQEKAVSKKPKKEETLENMHWKKFQKLAKDIGETWTTKDPREPIIEKLNVQEST